MAAAQLPGPIAAPHSESEHTVTGDSSSSPSRPGHATAGTGSPLVRVRRLGSPQSLANFKGPARPESAQVIRVTGSPGVTPSSSPKILDRPGAQAGSAGPGHGGASSYSHGPGLPAPLESIVRYLVDSDAAAAAGHDSDLTTRLMQAFRTADGVSARARPAAAVAAIRVTGTMGPAWHGRDLL